MHEQDALDLVLRYHLTPDALAFDVGANAGHVSVKMADLCRQVIAFEPNLVLARRLHELGRPNIQVVGFAVSDVVGPAVLHIDDREGAGAVASSLIDLSGMEGHTTDVEVHTITLDALCAREAYRPDFIKIDVEGHEEAVLAGARETIRMCRPVIVFEMWGGWYERMLPTITWLSETHKLVRVGDGLDVSVCAQTPGGSVDDVLCIPRRG